MEMDLVELANIKLKLDIYGDLYKEKIDALKAQLKANKEKEVIDEKHGLKLKLADSGQRDFSIEGVKQVFGDKAKLCIEESVSAKKFDALAKKGKEYVITEEQQKKCFMTTPKPSLSWDGLDVYRSKLSQA